MADHDQAARVLSQEVPQPGDRVGVEVVGRFVEQQGGRLAGVGEQDAGELDAPPLATGQRVAAVCSSTRSGRPRFAQIRAASLSAAYPPSAVNRSSRLP